MEGQTGQQEELFVEIDQKTDDQAYSDGEAASCTTDGNEIVNIIITSDPILQGESMPRRYTYSWRRRIQKVLPLLKMDEYNRHEYDPKVVSLGPYHHGKTELQLAEDFKHIALEMFVSGSSKDVAYFYNKILEVVDNARSCYVDGSIDKYNDHEFALMMLLDACFIINHIELSTTDRYNKLRTTRHHLGMLALSTTVRDMFLLENQIPFWILKLLISLRYDKNEGDELLEMFLNFTLFGEYEQKGEMSYNHVEEPLHLLEAFRTRLVSQQSEVRNFHRTCTPQWLKRKKSICNDRVNMKSYIHSFRSVTDLKAKGIQFKPSCTHSLKDIKFKSRYFYGQLVLPTWYVSIYTKAFFLNMIAYEMCPNTVTDRAVTSYVYFMKSLIESPRDVKELREKQILFNMLGSDEEVARMYKEINTYGVNNAHIFYNVKEKIQEHYHNKAKTWIAELIHTYFRSPWTALALLAATFLLCLTFTQTYFTINPNLRS
ncbi:hypothetical protein KY290_006246 [Solanum tuberosum]|uniref:Uncharacterized protein n=2 Tax=Solanum tuberosum TaxID=4113 RepID=M1AEM2_SOLTU|nr:hypothetical protein KY284_006798 [Solanum tuberosum]KAH0779819.1 hypothetical protein KY290_006246 [Solanum tuberosum]